MASHIRAAVGLALAATLAAAAAAWPTHASAQTGSPRSVLVIHVGAESFPSNPLLDAGIREALTSHGEMPIDYYTEYLESDLFPVEQASLAFTEYLRRKYQGRRIDVVIAMTSNGLQYVLDHRGELFPNAPIVFFGLAAPDDIARRAGGGITGITVGVAYAETLKLALALHPSTQRVFVVAKGQNEQVRASVRAELREFSSRLSVTYLNAETIPVLLSAVKAIPPGSVILFVWHSQADRGSVMYPDRVARLVTDAATVPVYGTSDLYLGSGVVGGVVRSTRATGTRIGELALRILGGTRPQDIPIETAPVAPLVDWRQVQRWGIAESRLPASAQVLFREPSAWQVYKVYIYGAVTALFAQAALIAGLLVQRARRREAELRARLGQAALRKSYERVRDLGARLLDAQETERSRIARELHDDVSQQLAVLKIDLQLLSQTAPSLSASAAVRRAQEIATSVSELSHRLHPARLRLMGLAEALAGLQVELSGSGVTVTFTHENVPPALRPDLTLCLFRVAQEALRNAITHAKARTVSVDVRTLPEGIALTIADDGVGFDVDRAWGKGLGLISVRERVEAVGGTVEIRSNPGVGTTLAVRVPASTLPESATPAV